MKLDKEIYEEIVRRLVSLRELSAELADAYDDPVSKKGAEDMRESLDRVIRLMEHRE